MTETEIETVEKNEDAGSTPTRVKTFTESEVQVMVDKAVQKGVETFREGKFENSVTERVNKTLEEREHKTPEQIQIIELQKQLNEEKAIRETRETENLKASNVQYSMNELQKAGIPTELASLFSSSNKEQTESNLKVVVDSISNLLTQAKQGSIDKGSIDQPFSKTTTETVNKPPKGASKADMKEWLKNNR